MLSLCVCVCVCVCVFPTSFTVLEDKEHALLVTVFRALGMTSDKNQFPLDSPPDLPFPCEYLNSPPRQDKSIEQCGLLEQ